MRQHPINEPSQVRGHGLDGFAGTEATAQVAEASAQIAVATGQRAGRHTQGLSHTILHIALSTDQTRDRLDLSETEWQAFLQGNPAEVVHAVVEQIGYDGTTGGVRLKLRSNENPA